MRVEIAEQKLDKAIRTLETGLAFAEHVAKGPFFINALVGIAIANLMLEKVKVLITQPGAPNLYWALTTLPQPFVSLRNSFENEQVLVESMIPELTEAELARPHSSSLRRQRCHIIGTLRIGSRSGTEVGDYQNPGHHLTAPPAHRSPPVPG
jgi:hypothetical protein